MRKQGDSWSRSCAASKSARSSSPAWRSSLTTSPARFVLSSERSCMPTVSHAPHFVASTCAMPIRDWQAYASSPLTPIHFFGSTGPTSPACKSSPQSPFAFCNVRSPHHFFLVLVFVLFLFLFLFPLPLPLRLLLLQPQTLRRAQRSVTHPYQRRVARQIRLRIRRRTA